MSHVRKKTMMVHEPGWPDPGAPFRWQDGERVVLFGRGRLAEADSLLPPPYVVLTTSRAASSASALVERAERVHQVAPGRVDELAAALRAGVAGELLVAIGGGRVIDVAKALAAADPFRRVAAIPTTLSGAEMTAVHRHATEVPADAPRVRPAIVVNDPSLSASQPPALLAASAANALGHAIEATATPLANPVATAAALHAARLIEVGIRPPRRDVEGEASGLHRDALALGSLLGGYAIGSAGYGLHHVLSQTLARFAGVAHADANAIMLPHSVAALEHRSPAAIASFREALGTEPAALALRLKELAGIEGLRGVSEEVLDRCAEEASRRAELHMTPPPASRKELRALYAAAA